MFRVQGQRAFRRVVYRVLPKESVTLTAILLILADVRVGLPPVKGILESGEKSWRLHCGRSAFCFR